MFEGVPVIRALNDQAFRAHLPHRVKEPDMDQGGQYAFIAKLEMSDYGAVGEVQTRLDRIEPHSLASVGLLLYILDPETESPLVLLEAESVDGIITPLDTDRRIVHRSAGNLGKITLGYLLDDPSELMRLEDASDSTLTAHAPLPETTDA